MRKAPGWRSWLPTSRQIRFKVQSALAKAVPPLGHHFNYFPDNANLAQPPSQFLGAADISSLRALPDHVIQFFTKHGALEQSRYPLPITSKGQMGLKLYQISEAMVLGRTGATVLKSQHRQIEAAAPNTMRFARLKDTYLQSPAINMVGMASGFQHYYHFLCDVAFPLLFMMEHLEPDAFPLTILLRKDLPEFQKEFYAHLVEDIPAVSIRHCALNERIHCKTLYHCATGLNCEYRAPASEQAASMVAVHYFSAYGIDPAARPTKKLYIARNDAKTRKIMNEKTLINQLQLRGFECVVPGELSHNEQVHLFNSALTIVGTHGAGLTNILFAQPDSKLIELFPADYIQSAYAWLAHIKGMSYKPIIGEKSGSHQNFTLSQSAISQILQEVDVFQSA